tara:strand:- start:189 stop:485 length:297 start_codon:yes stop_codon:yes gene_type:complete
MLQQLASDTSKIQEYLRQFKFQLPTISSNENKLIAINEQFKEMSQVLSGQCVSTLFGNIESVIGVISATYSPIETLKQAVSATTKCRVYLEHYCRNRS